MLDLLGDLKHKIDEVGPRELVEYFEVTLSNALRITDRRTIALVSDPSSTLDDLYELYISQRPN